MGMMGGAVGSSLQDRVVIVTGASRGIGRGIAVRFGAAGAPVVAVARGDHADAVVDEIRAGGGRAVSVEADITDVAQIDAVIKRTRDEFGRIDVLVNNAGIFRTEGVEETTSELWDQVLDINAKRVFLGTTQAIPELRKAGGGSIVNISSVAGLTGGVGSAAYRASKGAVRLFTKSTAIQYANDSIRANSVHPGIIDTPMTAPNLMADQERRERSAARHPLGRVGQPEDVAYGVLFLASEESSFMTGSELVIDGGLTAQ